MEFHLPNLHVNFQGCRCVPFSQVSIRFQRFVFMGCSIWGLSNPTKSLKSEECLQLQRGFMDLQTSMQSTEHLRMQKKVTLRETKKVYIYDESIDIGLKNADKLLSYAVLLCVLRGFENMTRLYFI